MQGFFVSATDTDAGKTAITVALANVLCQHKKVRIIKPIQTGCVKSSTGLQAPDIQAAQKYGLDALALHCYEPPCSPHLAAQLAQEHIDCARLSQEIQACAQKYDCVLVEGAGGVYVPINEQESMLDLMQRLHLPVLLVVSNKLGCLNHALLSIEALQNRAITIAGLIVNRTQPASLCDTGCGPWAGTSDEKRILEDNARTLAKIAQAKGIPFLADIPFQDGDIALEAYLEKVRPFLTTHFLDAAAQQASDIVDFDRAHLWHPYTSASKPLPVYEVQATKANKLLLADGRELIDGMSSWWCAIHGYGQERLQTAMTAQVHTMSHVMFGGITHKPAVALGERLLRLVPKGLEHIFYADSGSVAVEVALKMAVQYQLSLGYSARQHFLTPLGGYHGDTQGAMSVCDPINGMHTLFRSLLAQHYFIERPTCRFDAPFDASSLEAARQALEQHQDTIAAVILEPIVQGAGGMWMYHPQYLAGIKALCEEYNVVLIADEIATGFGRTGKLFACEWAGITPDIMCIGKGLTGGMMTGGATLTTKQIAFGIGQASAEQGGGLLMHGPTFMANPLFCQTACASIDLLESYAWQEKVCALEQCLRKGLEPCRGQKGVQDVRVLGAIGVVEATKPVDVARMQAFFVQEGVWIRPFAKNVYVMPPFITPEADVEALCAAIRKAVAQGLFV